MKTALSIAIILALGASPVLAKGAYCKDPVTHKRIACKVAAPAAAKPVKPAKPSLFAHKPATTAMAPAAAKPSAMAASATPAPGHKGIKCGHSYIAANKVCHKN